MGHRIGTCKEAYRLFRSDSPRDTLVAAGLLALVFGPFLYRFYLDNRGNTGRGSTNEQVVV